MKLANLCPRQTATGSSKGTFDSFAEITLLKSKACLPAYKKRKMPGASVLKERNEKKKKKKKKKKKRPYQGQKRKD